MQKYGDKRDYRKIDIYVKGRYVCTTTWSKTCKEARARYSLVYNIPSSDIKTRFAK